MTALALGALQLSPDLHNADPVALSQRSGGIAALGHGLEQRAASLTALAGQMQSGAWVSPAGSTFVATTGEQARHLRVAAGLVGQLAGALATLAGALATARTDALAAVARGQEADSAVEEFNHRLRVQHALLPQDPDSLLASGPQADELSARSDLAAAQLADAEHRAVRAWRQAQADFDVVAYGTPAMREKMSSGHWDPALSVSLAAVLRPGIVTSCGPMDDLGLPPNGVLTGPDGRKYDLVVQTTRGPDGRWLVSTQEQPADSIGWKRLAVRFGTTAYGHKADGWEKAAVFLGGAAGAAYPEGSTFAPSLLGELRIQPGGGAYLPSLPSEPGGSVKEAPAEAPRGKESNRYWVAPASGLASGRKASTPDGIGLLDAAIGGFLLARKLDDGRAADYRVVFEESSAGQRRARLQLFRVVAAPGSAPRTLAAGGYVDGSGKLAGAPVTGEPLNRYPSISEAGH